MGSEYKKIFKFNWALIIIFWRDKQQQAKTLPAGNSIMIIRNSSLLEKCCVLTFLAYINTLRNPVMTHVACSGHRVLYTVQTHGLWSRYLLLQNLGFTGMVSFNFIKQFTKNNFSINLFDIFNGICVRYLAHNGKMCSLQAGVATFKKRHKT